MSDPILADAEVPKAFTPDVGLHQNVPFASYTRWKAINHSTLERYGRSALHGHYYETHQADTSEAKELGSAAHVAILEPRIFEACFIGAPDFGDKRFKANKEAWENFNRENAGKEVLTDAEWSRVLGMRDAVYDHPLAAMLLSSPGVNEGSLVWRDFEYGILCKARLDRITSLNGHSVIVDLKTSRDARSSSMSRACYSYGYHRQGAWYIAAANHIEPRERKFVQIVVESEAPYAVAVYEIDGPSLEIGHSESRRNLDRYVSATKSGNYPGYDEGMGLLSIPAWALTFHGEEA